jgi:hypothetical protein
MVALAGTA